MLSTSSNILERSAAKRKVAFLSYLSQRIIDFFEIQIEYSVDGKGNKRRLFISQKCMSYKQKCVENISLKGRHGSGNQAGFETGQNNWTL